MIFIIFELLFFAILIVGDLVSKYYVMPFLSFNGGKFVVIDGVLTFCYSLNDGAGLSMLSGQTGVLIAMTVIAMLILLIFILFLHFKKLHKNHKGRFLLSSLIMILSGGIANLYDRVAFHGFVRDFIQYTFLEKIFGTCFFTCNLADIWVSVGVIMLLIYVLFMYRTTKPEPILEPDDDIDENINKALNMMNK